ncbi:nodulin homeobox-like [Salvia splendens]|uniref:nodulin homeobox-like n=1 Tax=Salvia splendens TaxID=180675 RepID=UPI001C267E92|nr:nodulin homeobox-like [Salvia splendens]
MSNVVNTCFCSRELELEFLFCIHVSASGTSFISVQLLHLCEAESVSYLEEVASKTSTQDVAKSVGLKVLALLKKMFNAPSEASYPKGQLELNAMRLADVLSDDSNFLSFIMINFVLALLKKMFNAPSAASYPKGQLELNAMRLAVVFSDDSNFRSFIMINFGTLSCNLSIPSWRVCIWLVLV